MTSRDSICITAKPGVLTEGLFGGIFLSTFEILPALDRGDVRPEWEISSLLYGNEPEYLVIPGILDLAYEAPTGPSKQLSLRNVRRKYNYALGSDWRALRSLWGSYFKIPHRIEKRADEVSDLSKALGIHYRGQDKVTASWDTNPIGHDEFIAVVRDFLGRNRQFNKVYVASDDGAFIERIRSAVELEVLSLGEGRSHKVLEGQSGRFAEAERAVLDCVLLSRCGAVLNTSSALSAFAKVLNPDLEIYRCAASKMFADAPYFPIAYIPIYESENAAVRDILSKTLVDDWTFERRAAIFTGPFVFKRLPFGQSTEFANTGAARVRRLLKALLLIFWPGLKVAPASTAGRRPA